ncbi:MAG: glycosyltransferase [Patescibacteria group bacterium]
MISIIIPTLNEQEYLPKLLDSIKSQDFSDYEIIVADAGSVDKTIEIAKNYGCIIVKGGLPAKARNSGAQIAKGDILLFLDSDSILSSYDFLSNSLDEFRKKNLGIAIFRLSPISRKIFDKISYWIWNRWIILVKNFFPHGAGAFLVKKSLHQSTGGFNESITFAEDQAYVATLSKNAKFDVIKKNPALISVRRFDKDGRIKTCIKYILADFHILFFGPVKSDIFKYKFGHYKNGNPKSKIPNPK